MEKPFGMLAVRRQSGTERFRAGASDLGFDLLSFWQWSCSDLLSNATRGVIAEFLVAQALGIAAGGVRHEWAAYDLETPEGVTVEVKSAAYLQRWHQERLSPISFLVPKTRAWDPNTGTFSSEVAWQAQVYVFALLDHKDKATVDPMDVSQWAFYVLPTGRLPNEAGSRRPIKLRALEDLECAPVRFEALQEAVLNAARLGSKALACSAPDPPS